MKNKRGQKTCSNCQTINGVRAYHCKKCDFAFLMKKKANKYSKRPVEDWTELKTGEYIKVIGRSGPYYISSNGEKMYLSDAGVYRIKSVEKDSLYVRRMGRHGGRFETLYMGPHKKSNLIDSIYRAPHKIIRVDYKER